MYSIVAFVDDIPFTYKQRLHDEVSAYDLCRHHPFCVGLDDLLPRVRASWDDETELKKELFY
jgi:hypothetical protein